jgi:hypothetical protein
MKGDDHIQQYYITEDWYVHVLLFPWNNIKKYIYLSFLYDGHQPHIFFYFLCQQNNMSKLKVEIDVTTNHYNNYITNTHTHTHPKNKKIYVLHMSVKNQETKVWSFLYKFIREYSNLIENCINLRISYWTKQYQKKIIAKWMLHQWLKHGYMHCETLLMLMVLSHSVLGILVACPLIPSKVFRTLYLPFHKMQCELAFQTHIHTYNAKVFPKY